MSNKLEFQIPEKDLIKYQESFEKVIETSHEFGEMTNEFISDFTSGFKEFELIILEKFQEPFLEIYQALKEIESQIDEFKEQK